MLNDAEIGAPNSLATRGLVGELVGPAVEALALGVSRRSTWNSEMKTGICGRIGRQPASGLTPRSFCSAIIAWLMPWRSLPYCLRSLAISGWSSCIARCDLTCLTNSGKRSSRMVTTRKTIASAQARPASRSRAAGHRRGSPQGVPGFITARDRGVQPVKQRRTPPARPARGRRGGSGGRRSSAAAPGSGAPLCSTSGRARVRSAGCPGPGRGRRRRGARART